MKNQETSGPSQKQDQSGDIDKQCHITKAGSPFMRSLLVECAQMILRDGAIETYLKVKGMRICVRGAKIANGKAITAAARQLAVLMVAMLKKRTRLIYRFWKPMKKSMLPCLFQHKFNYRINNFKERIIDVTSVLIPIKS